MTPRTTSKLAFQSVVDRAELSRANDRLLRTLKQQATKRARQYVGTPGGSDFLMTWHLSDMDIWIAPNTLSNRYWNAIGVGDPFATTKIAPTLEVNLRLVGRARGLAGRALRDSAGRLHIAHSGRIGGGKKGVGMRAFKAFLPNFQTVTVDGRRTELYMLGRLDSPDELAGNIADFAHRVADFKEGSPPAAPPMRAPFRPEFEGVVKTKARPGGTASYTHGRIVNALYGELSQRGLSAGRTKMIDLFIAPTKPKRGLIFEVKTSCDRQSVYTCVGQLMLLPPDDWAKVAVLPKPVPPRTRNRLLDLNISVLAYDLTSVVAFNQLHELLRTLGLSARADGDAD